MPVDIQSSSVFTEIAAESYGGTDGKSPSNVSKEDSERFSELLKERPAEGRADGAPSSKEPGDLRQHAGPHKNADLASAQGRSRDQFTPNMNNLEKIRHDATPSSKAESVFSFTNATEQERSRFSSLMNDLESGMSKLESSDEPQSSMASLFSQTNMGAFASQFNNAVQGSAPQEAPMLNAQEVQQIAERILVSAPESGAQEVRITPNSNLLPGTEIIVARDANGMLQVSVKTTDPAAFQTLVGAQGDLKDALQSRETQAVRVVISSDEAGAGDNDSRRRSAGLFEQQQEQEG